MVNNLYKISRKNRPLHDYYDSAIVCAPNPGAAAQIHPSGDDSDWNRSSFWVQSPEDVIAEYIGEAGRLVPEGVVLASFVN
jgi:hypothetical protein